jgi:hypothetical protein
MKHIGLLLILLVASTARADVVTVVFQPPALSGSPGDVLSFFGTLTNTTNAVVWLNGDIPNLPSQIPPAEFDDSPFWLNTPLYLAANGTTGYIGLFNITIPAGLPDGQYGGTFEILGGAASDSQDVLEDSPVSFTVGVGQETSSVPEPGTLSFLGFGAGALLVCGRVMRGIGRCGAR